MKTNPHTQNKEWCLKILTSKNLDQEKIFFAIQSQPVNGKLR